MLTHGACLNTAHVCARRMPSHSSWLRMAVLLIAAGILLPARGDSQVMTESSKSARPSPPAGLPDAAKAALLSATEFHRHLFGANALRYEGKI